MSYCENLKMTPIRHFPEVSTVKFLFKRESVWSEAQNQNACTEGFQMTIHTWNLSGQTALKYTRRSVNG